MSKDTVQLNDLVSPDETPSGQTSSNLFNNFLNAPVTKLDADEYTANDLDGVTEGLLGSGNMNFLMMQAGQTNEAISQHSPFDIGNSGTDFGTSMHSPNTARAGAAIGGSGIESDRPGETPSGLSGGAETNPLNTTTSSAGSLGASTLATNANTADALFSASSFENPSLPPANGTNGVSGTSGQNGVSGTNGTSGNSGTSGTNGIDGTDGTGTTIINNTTIIDDSILENVENIYNDTTNLVTEVVNNAGDIITTTIESTTDILTTIINSTTSIVNNLVNNIFGGTLGPIGISLDATIDDITNITLDIINGNTIINVINEILPTAPILTTVESLIGNLFSSTSLDVLLNPFQYDDSPNDVDLHLGVDLDILGISLPPLSIDLPLDIVEGLVGDLDISLDLTNALLNGIPLLGGGNADTDLGFDNLLGLGNTLDLTMVENVVEGLVNPVEDLLGDVDILAGVGLGLLGLGAGNDAGPDTDIFIPVNLGIADGGLLSNGLTISLDPLESIIGDVDLDLTVAANLLGNVAPGLVDTIAGGTGNGGLLADIGDTLGGLGGGLLPIGDSGDTDIVINTGIDVLDQALISNPLNIALDPVENLIGDIDLAPDVGLNLFDGMDTSGSDTDLSIPLDIALLDNTILDQTIEINLDPIEALLGDIDLDVPLGLDLLGSLAGNVVDGEEGGSGAGGLLAEAGDLLSDAVGSVLSMNSPTETLDIIFQDTNGIVTELTDLDPLGALASDIDENGLGLLGDILGAIDDTVDGAIGLVDSILPSSGALDMGSVTDLLGGGSGAGDTLGTWTESLVPDAGSALGDGLSTLFDTITDNPMADAIPVIPILPVPVLPVGGGLLGGLGGWGGSHGGGLFG